MVNIIDMVAPPLVDQQGSNNGITANVPVTRTKLIPRKGVTDSWRDELRDILASRKLTRITADV